MDLNPKPMTAKEVLERIKATRDSLIKRCQEKGIVDPEVPMIAPPWVWQLRQEAFDDGDHERVAYIDALIRAASGYY